MVRFFKLSVLLLLDIFFIHYYIDSEMSKVYFGIQAAFNHRWISHKGAYTRTHNLPSFLVGNCLAWIITLVLGITSAC